MRSIGTLRTARLLAKRLRPADFDVILRLNQDARAMAFIGGVRSEAKTREYMEESLAQWADRGYGAYIIYDADSGEAVGRAGLRRRIVAETWDDDLGYSFFPDSWGKGFATEIGAALLKVGFGPLQLESITAFTHTANAASRRVMEKLGFRLEKDFEFAGEPHVLYRIASRA